MSVFNPPTAMLKRQSWQPRLPTSQVSNHSETRGYPLPSATAPRKMSGQGLSEQRVTQWDFAYITKRGGLYVYCCSINVLGILGLVCFVFCAWRWGFFSLNFPVCWVHILFLVFPSLTRSLGKCQFK